tara:strand:+ start:79746 stop:80066 length:321 start_codon:yes stop_codon:yes gene_type:complete
MILLYYLEVFIMTPTQKMIGYGSAAFSVLWGVYSSIMESDATPTGIAANVAKSAAVIALPAIGAAILTGYNNATASSSDADADVDVVAPRRSSRANLGKVPTRLTY